MLLAHGRQFVCQIDAEAHEMQPNAEFFQDGAPGRLRNCGAAWCGYVVKLAASEGQVMVPSQSRGRTSARKLLHSRPLRVKSTQSCSHRMDFKAAQSGDQKADSVELVVKTC